ncbi:Uncharacterised protein [Mycolicibacterium fortuitum]|uniref:Uncharacterized protein n=1 Tax=Mycolicibacterium fortuitum TaxID=1766 RepID=A0A378WC65_MYCFO|nr:Uncharacterised protein [Mycolicibacterium fortuitum]
MERVEKALTDALDDAADGLRAYNGARTAAVEAAVRGEAQFKAACQEAQLLQRPHAEAIRLQRDAAEDLKQLQGEDGPGEDSAEYREAQQRLQAAEAQVRATRADLRAIHSRLDQSREVAFSGLVSAGASATEAVQRLESLEIETGFSPPF